MWLWPFSKYFTVLYCTHPSCDAMMPRWRDEISSMTQVFRSSIKATTDLLLVRQKVHHLFLDHGWQKPWEGKPWQRGTTVLYLLITLRWSGQGRHVLQPLSKKLSRTRWNACELVCTGKPAHARTVHPQVKMIQSPIPGEFTIWWFRILISQAFN